jgi:oligopeptide/dipeptide ABC transporter ATP-binding protein
MPSADMSNPTPSQIADDEVLVVRDLTTQFSTPHGTVRAVRNFELTVRRGETVALVGESGSGKSVSGLSIMGLLGNTTAQIVSGTALFRRRNGAVVDLLRQTPKQLQKIRGADMSMIFQDPMSSLNPVFKIGEQIAESIRVHQRKDRAQAWEMAVKLLREVGISDPEARAHAYPHQLSGGMRQRVVIAIALACDPIFMIADEPTTALDVTVQAQIIALLKTIQQERGTAMLFVSHDLHLVSDVADRVTVMYASQVLEEGPVSDVLHTSRHPYTKALLSCMPSRTGDGDGQLQPIPGSIPLPTNLPSGCVFHPRCGVAVPACAENVQHLEAVDGARRVRCHRHQDVS